MTNKNVSLFEAWGLGPEIRKGGLISLFAILVVMIGYLWRMYDDSESRVRQLSERNIQLIRDCQERERLQNEAQLQILRDALNRQQAIEDKLRAAAQNLKRKR